MPASTEPRLVQQPARVAAGFATTAFGCPRDYLGQRYVYAVVSPRARGLSIGLNLNPDRQCNFDCVYCEVDRHQPVTAPTLDVDALAAELEATLLAFKQGALQERPCYRNLPPELLELRHVTLSGDGEPTQCEQFADVVQAVVHLRALSRLPYFRLVLITNATGLDRPEVQFGLRFFTSDDEVWAKLDAGTQAYMDIVNRSQVPLTKVLENITLLGRQRPVVIQSLFIALNGKEPPPLEIEAYVERLLELKSAGANLPLVQIYSATRPTHNPASSHLPLRALSQIARRVREATGLNAEVF